MGDTVSAPPPVATADLSPCGRLVRQHDRDRYLLTLFVPRAAREALFSLYAFNNEVARVRDRVSELIIGRMRLQWWRDCLDEIYGEGPVRRHEVATPLADVIRAHDLPRAPFDRLVDARDAALERERFQTMGDLTDHAAATAAPLFGLAFATLGWRDEQAACVAESLGIAWALTGTIRAIPFVARERRCDLPGDLAARHGLDIGDVLELRSPPALAALVRDLAEEAGRHLAAARSAGGRVPRGARAVLLSATLADLHLRRLASTGWNPFDARVAETPGSAVWRLLLVKTLRRW